MGAKTAFTEGEWFWLDLSDLQTGVPYFAAHEGLDDGKRCGAVDGSKYWRLRDDECSQEQ